MEGCTFKSKDKCSSRFRDLHFIIVIDSQFFVVTVRINPGYFFLLFLELKEFFFLLNFPIFHPAQGIRLRNGMESPVPFRSHAVHLELNQSNNELGLEIVDNGFYFHRIENWQDFVWRRMFLAFSMNIKCNRMNVLQNAKGIR